MIQMKNRSNHQRQLFHASLLMLTLCFCQRDQAHVSDFYPFLGKPLAHVLKQKPFSAIASACATTTTYCSSDDFVDPQFHRPATLELYTDTQLQLKIIALSYPVSADLQSYWRECQTTDTTFHQQLPYRLLVRETDVARVVRLSSDHERVTISCANQQVRRTHERLD